MKSLSDYGKKNLEQNGANARQKEKFPDQELEDAKKLPRSRSSVNERENRQTEFSHEDSEDASSPPKVKARKPTAKRSLIKSLLDGISENEEIEEVQEEDYEFPEFSVADQRRQLEEKINKRKQELRELEKELDSVGYRRGRYQFLRSTADTIER